MKKIIAVALLICLLGTLTACKNTDKDSIHPYPVLEVEDDRVTIENDKKTFSYLGVSVSAPKKWTVLETKADGSSSYYFRDPKLGESCQFTLSITGSKYSEKRTEAEYLDYLSNMSGYENVKINSFTEEKLNGFNCTKIAFTYSKDKKEYVQVNYRYIVIGVRMYSCSIVYPAEKKDTYQPVFEEILNSVEFNPNV